MNRPENLKATQIPTDLSAFSQYFRRPGEYLCPDAVPFDDLTKAVKRHLLLNALPAFQQSAERFLVIQGAPGIGKTVTACDAALGFGFGVAMLPAALLASEYEGGATRTLDAFMEDVVRFSHKNKLRMTVNMEDFDLSIASKATNMTFTINAHLLTQRVQHIADTREFKNFDECSIPFIFTGNDFQMRESLFRPGRATWFTHAPSADEKGQVAHHMLQPRTQAQRKLIDQLVRTYANEPVSFWTSLKNDLFKTRLDQLITEAMPDPAQVEAELRRPLPLDRTTLQKLAKERSTTRATRFL
ncbi:MAG: hypothetical protein K0U74_12170 [Alphaproteobacteria bacterium]|nr:hypothetical protein [Alphaproteobacteria bacterium]